jgi:hypothetical protein
MFAGMTAASPRNVRVQRILLEDWLQPHGKLDHLEKDVNFKPILQATGVWDLAQLMKQYAQGRRQLIIPSDWSLWATVPMEGIKVEKRSDFVHLSQLTHGTCCLLFTARNDGVGSMPRVLGDRNDPRVSTTRPRAFIVYALLCILAVAFITGSAPVGGWSETPARPVERAFELARDSSFTTVEKIRRKLKAEGYIDWEFQLAGRGIRRQLQEIVAAKRDMRESLWAPAARVVAMSLGVWKYPDKPWNETGFECSAGMPCPQCNELMPPVVPVSPPDFEIESRLRNARRALRVRARPEGPFFGTFTCPPGPRTGKRNLGPRRQSRGRGSAVFDFSV